MIPKHIVIFSHGFGTLRDARGLFTDIVDSLPHGIIPVLFDYNTIDSTTHDITVPPPSEQAEVLDKVINETKEKYPDAIIDLICHSQGGLIAGILSPTGIRKTILIAPSLATNIKKMINTFQARAGTKIDRDGWSSLTRRDGSRTLVPKEYWKDREGFLPIPLYNVFADKTSLTIINANQDDVLDKKSCGILNEKIEVIALDGNHEFSGQYRTGLLQTLSKIL